jgi:hypothetical protein
MRLVAWATVTSAPSTSCWACCARRSVTPPDKFADLPLVRSCRAAIEALNREKEEHVANGEFEQAAAKRDEADQIKRKLFELIQKLEAEERAGAEPEVTAQRASAVVPRQRKIAIVLRRLSSCASNSEARSVLSQTVRIRTLPGVAPARCR